MTAIEVPAGGRSIDEILAAARSRLRRLTPAGAYEAQQAGAVLVDTRPIAQRAAHGVVRDALAVERNVLEWRFDPRSDARVAVADRYDLPVIVYCQQGYSSSLAAAALQDLGLYRATDVIGGFEAWRVAGLPVTRLGVSEGSSHDRPACPPPESNVDRRPRGARPAAPDTGWTAMSGCGSADCQSEIPPSPNPRHSLATRRIAS